MAERNGRNLDPGTRLILTELRDLRVEMRADRRRDTEERREADERWRQERRQADGQLRQERLRSDDRFEQLLRDFRQDSARREAATQKVFKDIRAVGLSIVKTLNRHTRILEHHGRILERIDRNLGARRNGPPRQDNGSRT